MSSVNFAIPEHHELEAMRREMSDPNKMDAMDRILDRFGHVQEEYEHSGGRDSNFRGVRAPQHQLAAYL